MQQTQRIGTDNKAMVSTDQRRANAEIAAPPSIFNDAIGPVMRGASSSHCAAAHRIGSLCLDLLGGKITSIIAEYDSAGALAATHQGQGTDMGLYGAILGYAIDDPRLVDYGQGLADTGIVVEVRYLDYGAAHPNNYGLTIRNNDESRIIEAVSTGGGMIEIRKIDGAAVFFSRIRPLYQIQLQATYLNRVMLFPLNINQLCLVIFIRIK